MYLKIHETKEGKIVAVCDEYLIGKKFEEGDSILDLAKYKDFYKGKKASNDDIKNAFKTFSSANLVGEKSVKLAIYLGIVFKESVKYIKGIPYVQIYQM